MNAEAKTAWLKELEDESLQDKQIVLSHIDINDKGEKCYCAMGLLVKAYEESTGDVAFKQGAWGPHLDMDKVQAIQMWSGFDDHNCGVILGPHLRVQGKGFKRVAHLNDSNKLKLWLSTIS